MLQRKKDIVVHDWLKDAGIYGETSVEEKSVKILNEMAEYLNISQMKKLLFIKQTPLSYI